MWRETHLRAIFNRQRIKPSFRHPAIQTLSISIFATDIPMSSPAVSTSKLRTYCKWAALSLLLVALCWTVVILWWQATHRVVTIADAVLYLAALPFVLLVCIGLAKWRSVRKSAPAELLLPQSVPVNMEADAKRHACTLPVLRAWAVTSCASTGGEFIAALSERRMRPLPDAMLTDDDGFPLLAARVADLDCTQVEQALAQAIAGGQLPDAPAAEDWRDAIIRSLALLGSLIDQTAEECPWLTNAPGTSIAAHEEEPVTLRGMPASPDSAATSFHLHVKLLVPAGLLPHERQFALAYLRERLPFLQSSGRHLHLDLVETRDDAAAFALANEFSAESQRDRDARALLLLACDSLLCPAVIEEWQANARLFNPRNPNGLMPGEAAFGIMCANDSALQALDAEPACHLTPVIRKQRDISADTPAKLSSSCLMQVVAEALDAALLSGDLIGTVAADTDHRSNRVLECISAMMQHTPQLDAISNRFAVNEACGHLGAASAAGILAAGVLQASDAAHPVLLLNVNHALDRAAAVLIPAA